MCWTLIYLTSVFSLIYQTHGALLLWSKRKIEISALKQFTNEDLHALVRQLGYPETAIYKSSASELQPEFKELVDGYYTAYSANDEIDPENATEISTQEDLQRLRVKQQFESSQDNILSMILIPNKRYKRESLVTTTMSPAETFQEATEGPVFYRGKFKNNDTFGLMYSTQPLSLRSSNFSTLYLGNTSNDMITVDTQARDSYTRLNLIFPIDENKVTLRFIFVRSGTYWSLTSVKISDTQGQYNFNLSIEHEVTAPVRFSYHCSDMTVFSDNSAELRILDLQVQIDSTTGGFHDAYDCVSFTTAPIWAGIFVTALLGLGLVIALNAIGGIKTMDKFDNTKTKQLAITVTE